MLREETGKEGGGAAGKEKKEMVAKAVEVT